MEQDGGLVSVSTEFATSGYMRVLGFAPSRGRWFDEAEDLADGRPVAVITHKMWRDRLGSGPNVIGTTVRIGGSLITVIGVGPIEFNRGAGPAVMDMWLSISALRPTGSFAAQSLERRQDHPFLVRARLLPGVSVEQAQVAMTRLGDELAATYPVINEGRRIHLARHRLAHYEDGAVLHPSSESRMNRIAVTVTFLALVATSPAMSQDIARLESQTAVIRVERGATAPLVIRAFDAAGRPTDGALRVSGPRRGLAVDGTSVRGLVVGEYEIVVTSVPADGAAPVTLRIPVHVDWPAITEVRIETDGDRLYEGARVPHGVAASHRDGSRRQFIEVSWDSSDEDIATVDAFGNVRAVGTGTVTISASVEGVRGEMTHTVVPSPVASMSLVGGLQQVRTGDVQSFTVTAFDEGGSAVDDAPISWSFIYQPDDSIKAPAGPAQILEGRMVADVPGVYTAIASTAGASAEYSFRVVPRDVIRKIEIVGHGSEARIFTTDFWIWEGLDGRDYALTGSKYGDGISMVWDVTDPANIFKTDSIPVDARSTNDMKVSPDGRYGVISREGASSRRNGLVILDLAEPAHPRIASTFESHGVTGGVHNMFATNDYLFSLANGDKYVIIDVRDLDNPKYVSEYNHPDSRVHDVFVHDGLAYSAEWETGVVVVDVGNGKWGGSIENPQLVTVFPTTTGSTHAIFPYYQESTGRFLLIVGDERVQRRGLAWEGTGPDHRQQYDPITGKGGYPRATSGYTQIFDFTDPTNPVQLARYEASEYGTHNMWVEDDVLYQAYYEGGVRMVDISGDLMGNLYTQGREMAVFKAHDPVGYIPNAPGVWSVMPWKGNIFFSDINSGMWAVKMVPTDRPIS